MGKKRPAASESPRPEDRTTAALYAADALDLKQLAVMLDISVADAYRRLCVPVVRLGLQAELRRRTQELDRDKS